MPRTRLNIERVKLLDFVPGQHISFLTRDGAEYTKGVTQVTGWTVHNAIHCDIGDEFDLVTIESFDPEPANGQSQ